MSKYEHKWWHKLPQLIRPPYKGQTVNVSTLYWLVLQIIILFETFKWLVISYVL